jgi:hypothetical protein
MASLDIAALHPVQGFVQGELGRGLSHGGRLSIGIVKEIGLARLLFAIGKHTLGDGSLCLLGVGFVFLFTLVVLFLTALGTGNLSPVLAHIEYLALIASPCEAVEQFAGNERLAPGWQSDLQTKKNNERTCLLQSISHITCSTRTNTINKQSAPSLAPDPVSFLLFSRRCIMTGVSMASSTLPLS